MKPDLIAQTERIRNHFLRIARKLIFEINMEREEERYRIYLYRLYMRYTEVYRNMHELVHAYDKDVRAVADGINYLLRKHYASDKNVLRIQKCLQ